MGSVVQRGIVWVATLGLCLVCGCASTSGGTSASGTSSAVSKTPHSRDPSKIHGDPALDEAYASWAAAGYPEPDGAHRYALDGKASWYGPGLNGNHTASGEIFGMDGMTAAHKKLPFGSIGVVTNERNGRSVVVRINDRGPFVAGRIIDLSYGAAYLIDMITSGVVPVRVEIIRLGK